MRKTADLVIEMFDEAKGARLVAMAVGFADETEFVFNTTPHPLEQLNALIKKGGSPIGLLRFERQGTELQGSYRPFEEYRDVAWANEYLAGLLKNAGEIIALSQQQPAFPGA